MPKFLISANYTHEGMKGVREKGAKSRLDAVSAAVEGLGGRLESFHFAFGDTDAYVIVDMPDDESAAAIALSVSASGAVTMSTTKLLTIEQVDEALGRGVKYSPPGS
jgi:uncharacterized protein with GYD domain